MVNFTPGQKASFKKTITKELIEEFARLTGDQNPPHVSREFATSKGFSDVVSHGLLTASFYSTMAGMHLPGNRSMCLSVDFQFPNPVYPGDTLEYTAEITKVSDEHKIVDLDLNCFNQHGTVVIRGKMRVLTRYV